MAEDIVRHSYYIIVVIRLIRQAGLITPQVVENSHLNSIPRRFLISPLIDSELLLFQLIQQANRNLLDPLDVVRTEIVLLQ